MPQSDLGIGAKVYQSRFQPYRSLAQSIFTAGQQLERSTAGIGEFLKSRNKDRYRTAAFQELQQNYPHVRIKPEISLNDLSKGIYQIGVVNSYYDNASKVGANLVKKDTLDNLAFHARDEDMITLVKSLDDARQMAEGKTMSDLYGKAAAGVGEEIAGKRITEPEVGKRLATRKITTPEGRDVHMPVEMAQKYAGLMGADDPRRYMYRGPRGRGAAGAAHEITPKLIANQTKAAAVSLQKSGAAALKIAQKAADNIFLSAADKQVFMKSGADPVAVAEYVKWAVASRELAKTKDAQKAFAAGMDAYNKISRQLNVLPAGAAPPGPAGAPPPDKPGKAGGMAPGSLESIWGMPIQ